MYVVEWSCMALCEVFWSVWSCVTFVRFCWILGASGGLYGLVCGLVCDLGCGRVCGLMCGLVFDLVRPSMKLISAYNWPYMALRLNKLYGQA